VAATFVSEFELYVELFAPTPLPFPLFDALADCVWFPPAATEVAVLGPVEALSVFVLCEFPEFVSLFASVLLTVELPDPETVPPVALPPVAFPPCEVEDDLLLPPDAVAFELDVEFELLLDVALEALVELLVCD
jgi:hypothetical protein